eukprot:TRINITY_DN7792_c0_g1_i6.p1 TRINITY_DN7792_c0_g1~~TRINITY_DN7792_c0_g1_i6.p1  ORF type:complete len:336 (-),score=95.04 TRINITY_DN7792_c0_g1_i6:1257-2264(-)
MLPSAIEEFKTKEYWDKFFEKRGGSTFEWYGSYKTYKSVLAKEIPRKSRILIAGCGNSLMAEEMCDDGYESITSVDYSQQALKEAEERKKERDISYVHMDLTDIKFAEDSFDTIIDKATLDAMFCNEEEDTIAMVRKTWENYFRVLAHKGRYVCITLLQQQVLSGILSYFMNGNNNPLFVDHAFIVRIYEAEADLAAQPEQRHVPFVLVIEKSKLDMTNEGSKKVKDMFSKSVNYISQGLEVLTIDRAIERVKERQMFGFVMSQSKSFVKGQRFHIECYDPKSPIALPKYKITVVDSKNEKNLRKKLCGVFIAPLGRENDYLFATEEGNFYLQSE